MADPSWKSKTAITHNGRIFLDQGHDFQVDAEDFKRI